MTVGVYAISTGENEKTRLQTTVVAALARHKDVVQEIHGFYYFEKEHRISVDIVPDISVKDDEALLKQLKTELESLIPDEEITIVIDHNYSE